MKGLPGIGMVIKGVRSAIGKSTGRRSRHRQSQMKAASRGRFSGRGAKFGL